MDKEVVIKKLTEIFDLELSGVIRYTHYSLMIFGPNRLPLISFFKEQALGKCVVWTLTTRRTVLHACRVFVFPN